jgi:RND family efflux transporter MFP subunit
MARSTQFPRKLYQILASLAGLVVLLVWIEGGFTAKTPPGTTPAEKEERTPGPSFVARYQEIEDIRSWPGTVSARSVAQIASKVPARVIEITVRAGDVVQAGQVLARLDQQEAQARLNQARATLASAEAQSARVAADARRTQALFDREAATRQALDAALAAARSGAAQVAEARAAVAAAASVSGAGVLRAPFEGAVIRRLLEPGDMALPGQPVLALQSSRRLRVEAAVPESCARTLRLGQELRARLGEARYPAVVEEIAPAVDPETRTVLVKTALDPAAPTQPGTFAWLEQGCGRHRALLIPASALRRTGQLESVRVLIEGHARLRHVRTGEARDGTVEVLSGLREGDRILLGGGP